jgi:hypothetical protein
MISSRALNPLLDNGFDNGIAVILTTILSPGSITYINFSLLFFFLLAIISGPRQLLRNKYYQYKRVESVVKT